MRNYKYGYKKILRIASQSLETIDETADYTVGPHQHSARIKKFFQKLTNH